MEKKTKTADMSQMLTANQLAKEWGVPPAEVRKKLKETEVKADYVRCGCSYYLKGKAAGIRRKIGL